MDYKNYKFGYGEIIKYILIWGGISAVLAYFFYRSAIGAIVLFLFLPLFMKYERKKCQEKRAMKMRLEFKEMLRFLSTELQTGESVENALFCVYREMKKMFGEKSEMVKECEAIVRGIENNVVTEKLFMSLGVRSGIDEIYDFSEVFYSANRSKGNLREIILDTTETINAKIEMKREFETMISAKRFEQRIMCVIPFFIIGYIGITSPGYFDMLYKNLSGVAIMTVVLLFYIGAFLWGEKIVNIEK